MKCSPGTICRECNIWTGYGIGMIVSALLLVMWCQVCGIDHWSISTPALQWVAIGSVAVWCLWVIRAFYSMSHWWKTMQDQLNHAQEILVSADADLKEIRENARPKNIR